MSMILLIVNPVAGKRRAHNSLMDIIAVFNAAGYDVNVRLTQCRGDAFDLAASSSAGLYERIICVGGDGTLNEVISGLMASGSNIPLGYIPMGSTNDFATSLKLNKDPIVAAHTAIEGEPQRIDIGQFNGDRHFSYIASFGMFTSASYSASQSIKNTLGHFAYILEGIKSIKDIINIKSYSMHIEADGEEYEGDYVFGAIANSTSIGGILKLNSEMVNMSDGLFEMMLIRRMQNAAEFSQVLISLANSDYNNKMFDFIHASDICIESHIPMNWSLDGEEASSGNRTVIKNLHNAIAIAK